MRARPLAVAVLLAFAVAVATAAEVRAQDFEYLANDSLDFGSASIEAYTTGDILGSEWLGVRVTNTSDEVFYAEEVQLLVASPTGDDLLLFPQCAGRTPRTTIRAEIRVWESSSDTALAPGTLIARFGAEEDDEELELTVNAVSAIDLGGEMPVGPGESIRIGVNFPEGARACTGSLMQDSRRALRSGIRNYLQGTIIGGLFCDDAVFRWRDFNGDCDSEPPGVGGRGDLAIRLARRAGSSGTPDTGTGTPDVGAPDASPDMTPDLTPDLTDEPDAVADLAPDLVDEPDAVVDLAPDLVDEPDATPDLAPDLVVEPDAAPDATPDTAEDTVGIDVPAPAAFSLRSVSPTTAPTNADTLLTFTGTGFTDALSVRIGPSIIAGLSVEDDRRATGTLAAGLPVGLYDIIATQGDDSDTLSSAFQVTAAVYDAPVIDDVSVTQAYEGESVEVTITGSNFAADADVTFGPASGFSVDVDPAGTSLTVRSPGTLTAGVYDIEVENPDGQSDIARSAWRVVDLGDSASPDGCSVARSGAHIDLSWLLACAGLVVAGLRRPRRLRGHE
jgi:hypothetical protein